MSLIVSLSFGYLDFYWKDTKLSLKTSPYVFQRFSKVFVTNGL